MNRFFPMSRSRVRRSSAGALSGGPAAFPAAAERLESRTLLTAPVPDADLPYFGQSAPPAEAAELQKDAEPVLLRLAVPVSVRAAFDEAAELFRAVEGHESTLASFVEALVGEAASGPAPGAADPDLRAEALHHVQRRAKVELAAKLVRMVTAGRWRWNSLASSSIASVVLAAARINTLPDSLASSAAIAPHRAAPIASKQMIAIQLVRNML